MNRSLRTGCWTVNPWVVGSSPTQGAIFMEITEFCLLSVKLGIKNEIMDFKTNARFI